MINTVHLAATYRRARQHGNCRNGQNGTDARFRACTRYPDRRPAGSVVMARISCPRDLAARPRFGSLKAGFRNQFTRRVLLRFWMRESLGIVASGRRGLRLRRN